MTALKLEKKKERKNKKERKHFDPTIISKLKKNSQFSFSLKVDKNCKNSFEKFSKKLSTLVS